MFAPVLAADLWTRVTSPNFLIVGDAGGDELRRCSLRLEQFRESIEANFPRLKLDGGVRTNVVVFKSAATYAPFRPRRPDGSVDEAIAGYFQRGEDFNCITLAIDSRPGVYGTIFHEYVHFLLDTNIGRADLPPWLNEGIAEYFETFQLLDDGRVSLGTPPSGHLNRLRQNQLIPLKQFLIVDNAGLHTGATDRRSVFYAQAWALTHLLMHNDAGGDSSAIIDEVVRTLSRGSDQEALLKTLFGADLPAIEATLAKYIAQPALPSRIFPAGRQSTDFTIKAEPLTESQSLAYKGDLLYHTKRIEDAEVMLRKALALDNRSGAANMSLGLVLAHRQDFSNAQRHLERAIALDTTNHYGYFNLAYAISRQAGDGSGNVSSLTIEDSRKMQDALNRAIELRPEFAESYRLLAFVHLVNGTRLDEAAELVRKGLTKRPGDQELNLMLAEVLIRQEKYADARAIAQKLIGTAADPGIWSRAKGVVSTADQNIAAEALGRRENTSAAVFGPLEPIVLKRSEMSDEEAAAYEQDRVNANLNRLIDRPQFAEKLVVGYIDRVRCAAGGEITFAIRTAGGSFLLERDDFKGLGMRVVTEGERTFTIGCGVSLSDQLTVLKFKPSAGSRGLLLSIAFVPDYFQLKTAEEMANRRTVIIEDDRPLKAKASKISVRE